MSAFSLAWTWCVIQITVLGMAGALVYGAARRLGPAAGSLVASTTLLLTSCVTVLAFVPLPAWTMRWISQRAPTQQAAVVQTADPSPTHAIRAAESVRPNTSLPTDRTSLAPTFTSAFQDEFARAATRATTAPQRRWWGLGGLPFVIIATLGLVRIGLSFRAVHRLRQRAVPLRDQQVTQQIDELARELKQSVPRLELRESSELGSAATWGWLHPIIVLPIEWREWSPETLRAVLAHELAHILRRDYLVWLLAQVGVALHVYHPILHWLAGRLRQDQECAADVTACQVAGGPRAYLSVLATMAIEQDDRRLSWSAHPFLPSRRTFLRRIEMLRGLKRVPLPPSRLAQGATIAALLVLAMVASGFRSIRSQAEVYGQAPPTEVARGEIRFDYIPRDAIAVAAARPAQLLGHALLANQKESWNELDKAVSAKLRVPLSELEQITAVTLSLAVANVGEAPIGFGLVIRTTDAVQDQEALAKKLAPDGQTSKYGEYQVYRSNRGFCAFPDEHTIVLAQDEGILRRILIAGADAKVSADVADTWSKAADSDAALFVNSAYLRTALDTRLQRAPEQQKRLVAALAPLWQNTTSISGSLRVRDQVQVQILAGSQKVEDRKVLRDTLSAAMTLARNIISSSRVTASRIPDPQGPALLKSLEVAEGVLDETKVTEEQNLVVASASLEGSQMVDALKILTSLASASKDSAQRTVAANNMKRIALAMHNYHDANGQFPPAAVIGPDGKTVHSWRVALLPYLEQDVLYREYRFDEPWDSPNNTKVLEKMPDVFRDPSAPRDSTSASYFVVTGEGTMFTAKEGTEIRDIIDGTSNTIMIVEAKRDTPWTKPEDIEFNGSDVPQFGGYHEGGFNTAFADGSVRFLSERIQPNVVKLLLLIGDGTPIPPLN